MKRKIVYLIEWRHKKTHHSELGKRAWEVDHNGEIWFTKAGATSKMNERLSDKNFSGVYEMRVTSYSPGKTYRWVGTKGGVK